MKSRIIRICAFNACYLIYLLHYIMPIGGYALSLLSNLILFILPGLAWANIIKQKNYKRDLVVRVLMVFSISVLICLICLAGHILLQVKVTPVSQVIFLAVVTNAGLLFKGPCRLEEGRGKAYWPVVFGLILYTLAYFFSSYSADEPFEDSDLDLQGTAYGLVNHLTPRMLTDRKTFYNFSHPLLPAFCAANTILLFDHSDKLKYYFDASLEAEKITNEVPLAGEKIILASSTGKIQELQINQVDKNNVRLNAALIKDIGYEYGRFLPAGEVSLSYDLIKEAKIWRIIESCYRHFFQAPYLVATRSPQFLFTALTGLVLCLFLFQATGSQMLALLGSIFYLTIPEIFIAQASTNYMAITNFTMAMAAYLYYQTMYDQAKRKEMKIFLFISGFLCAITNQKTYMLFAAIFAGDIISGLKARQKNGIFKNIRQDYCLAGFIFGVTAYWLYGLAIHPYCFFMDHLRHHLLDRIFHINPLGYTGYLSVFELWKAYSINLGQPFFWLALFITGYYLKYFFREERNLAMLVLWFIFGAIAFTLVDFRQTLNLIYVTIPLIILTMRWISERKGFFRALFLFVLIYVLIFNVQIIREFILGIRQIRGYLLWL